MPAWDNTARRGGQATVFHGSTPATYAAWLKDACDVTNLNPTGERLLFINAWNEWGEGAHLEPDARYGYAYLEATANVLRTYYADDSVDRLIAANNQRFARKSKAALILHCYHEDLLYEIGDRYLRDYRDAVDVFATVRPDVSRECIEYLENRVGNVLLIREENRGRDMRPFLLVLRRLRELGYEVACKVHTKRSPQLENGDKWRDWLISSLLGGGDAISLAEEQFSRRPDLGLLVPSGSLIDLGIQEINAGNRAWLDRLLLRMGRADLIGSYRTWFPAGSMYWFRVDSLAGLPELILPDDPFEPEAGQLDGTLAHAIERLIVLYAETAGYEVEEFDASRTAISSPSRTVQLSM
jgi:lipopolysaccharide biosynthesis protein